MSNSNYIKNVAIVGAGGNVGKFITEALLRTGKHNVTAITREDSKSTLPEGIIIKKVNYDDQATLVEALRGQDALVVTLSGHALGLQDTLSKAAAEAGVPWVIPNAWCPDLENEGLVRDVPMFQSFPPTFKKIEELGKSSYVVISTGFWYEWSLAIAPAFGFDLKNRAVTLFDEGETKISISTWPQVGRAVASLLSLPIRAEAGEKACLETYRNKLVYVKSFTVSQKEMLESVLRVTETKLGDWKVEKEPSHERYAAGFEAMKKGDRSGFGKVMYTRVFYPDGTGDTEHSKGTINEALGLLEEDIDEYTKVAIERSKAPQWHEQ